MHHRTAYFAAVLAAILFSGCSSHYSVRMNHRLPSYQGSPEVLRALSSVYISVKPDASVDLGKLGKVLNALAGDPAEFEASAFAADTAAGLFAGGLGVAAYRVSPELPDPLAARFSPSGLLSLAVSPVRVSVVKTEKDITYKDKSGAVKTGKSATWTYTAAVSVQGSLAALPGGAVVDYWTEPMEYSEQNNYGDLSASDWYSHASLKAAASFAARVARRYAGKPSPRFRPVYFEKKDKPARRAARAAGRGGCGSSSSFWSARAAAGGTWRDLLGLAVCHEAAGDYAAAREKYLAAREKSAGDKQASGIRWEQILSDLDRLAAPAQGKNAAAEAWFGRRVALLPLAEETNSIDGPPMLREMLHEALAAGGYAMQPLAETDDLLRRQGYSDGSQLRGVRQDKLCKWLSVDAVIAGDITEFGEIMAGVYNRRQVAGSFVMSDSSSEYEVWSSSGAVTRVKTSKSLGVGLLSQLGKGLYERMRNKPLYEEASLFVRKITGSLPRRPK